MPTKIESFIAKLEGGLINNISPLQQGINIPGSARLLQNFEPSIEGGYKRVKGYTKYDDEVVPSHGIALVQGSGQTGTSLEIANIMSPPLIGDTFTIDGVTGTYTISTVSYDSSAFSATLTITPTLASSPADKAEVTFTNNPETTIDFVKYFDEEVLAKRGGHTYVSDGSGWTRVDIPTYSGIEFDVKNSSTSIDLTNFTSKPLVGDTFSIEGVEKVFTITAVTAYSGGTATVTITPSLSATPSAGDDITFYSHKQHSTNKTRGVVIKFVTPNVLITVDGSNNPQSYDGTNWVPINTELTGFDDAVIGAQFITYHKTAVFYAKNTNLCFTAPNTYNDFAAANGAGIINLPDKITGMITFREQLIIFCNKSIHRIVGSSLADYQLQPIIEDMGCIASDTIQEVGGDIMFLSQDGIRFLSATERIGDFGFAAVSRNIQKDLLNFVNAYDSFSSLVVREKGQYRIFGYKASTNSEATEGFLATQFGNQDSNSLAWSKLKGFKVYSSDSTYENSELIYFANNNGYVYIMESGKDFDGADITSAFFTPYFSFSDPRYRKSIHKINLYIVPDNAITATLRLRFDFGSSSVIQPSYKSIELGSIGALWGDGIWGEFEYGSYLETIAINNVEGSGFTTSLEFRFEGGGTFNLDTLLIEYENNDRR